MPPPSYGRATASSTLKSTTNQSPHAPPSKDPSTPKKAPKRPSTITPARRKTILYKSDLYPINPQDTTKPCPLSSLPSELRTTIYQHVLHTPTLNSHPHSVRKKGVVFYKWPPILHTSRAIRIEAAYIYYTSSLFSFPIRNLDFSYLRAWLDKLPRRHRALLGLNRSLDIQIIPALRHTYTYPPKGWLLDAPVTQHWRECAQFGNLYDTSQQLKFILFCRLMGWFCFNNAAPYREMKWRYRFDSEFVGKFFAYDAQILTKWAREVVGVVGMRGVVRAWTRGRAAGRGREEAMRFLGDLDEGFGCVEGGYGEGMVEDWRNLMEGLRKVVEKW
ncbi:hypothetical protein CC86DRAFT_346153 [Ophiobolus disseminans]|uniref:F-box domain-containing protein n=1 Tax=Ophiobolus disseminans TaxID=1469910 RepID=A0A6A7A9C9_9PLEO|nr:hypothetical protein CC86DRAFT_346153 [Ophiobolus disseminans]